MQILKSVAGSAWSLSAMAEQSGKLYYVSHIDQNLS